MGQALRDGVSTPRYGVLYAFGVCLGSLIRLGLWVMPASLAERAMERVLP